VRPGVGGSELSLDGLGRAMHSTSTAGDAPRVAPQYEESMLVVVSSFVGGDRLVWRVS
jgi:hypothetical protein